MKTKKAIKKIKSAKADTEKKAIKEIVVPPIAKKVVISPNLKAEKPVKIALSPSKPQETKVEEKSEDKFTVIESYSLEVDKAPVRIDIEKHDTGMLYKVNIKQIELGTQALLDEIRKELVSMTSFGAGEIIDKKSLDDIK
jgi:hypothetical protein